MHIGTMSLLSTLMTNNGTNMSEEYHKIPMTALAVVINPANEVLLMRRSPAEVAAGKYTLPGGHLEPGETAMQAAVRELQEETGIISVSSTAQVCGVLHTVDNSEYLQFVVNILDWHGEAKIMEPDVCDEILWSPLDALPKNLLGWPRTAISMATVTHSKPYVTNLGKFVH